MGMKIFVKILIIVKTKKCIAFIMYQSLSEDHCIKISREQSKTESPRKVK